MAVPPEPLSFTLKADTEKYEAGVKPQGSGRENEPSPKGRAKETPWSVPHCSLSRTQQPDHHGDHNRLYPVSTYSTTPAHQ